MGESPSPLRQDSSFRPPALRAAVEAFYDRVWNRRDKAAVAELIRPDFTFRGSLGPTMTGHAAFGVTFTGSASFNGVTFTGDALFNKATFTDDVSFGGATFTGDTFFSEAIFTGDAGTRQSRELRA